MSCSPNNNGRSIHCKGAMRRVQGMLWDVESASRLRRGDTILRREKGQQPAVEAPDWAKELGSEGILERLGITTCYTPLYEPSTLACQRRD